MYVCVCVWSRRGKPCHQFWVFSTTYWHLAESADVFDRRNSFKYKIMIFFFLNSPIILYLSYIFHDYPMLHRDPTQPDNSGCGASCSLLLLYIKMYAVSLQQQQAAAVNTTGMHQVTLLMKRAAKAKGKISGQQTGIKSWERNYQVFCKRLRQDNTDRQNGFPLFRTSERWKPSWKKKKTPLAFNLPEKNKQWGFCFRISSRFRQSGGWKLWMSVGVKRRKALSVID